MELRTRFIRLIYTNLFGQAFLPPGDNEQVIKEDQIHFRGLPRVQQVQWTLLQDLAPGTDDQALARLTGQRTLQELGEKLLGVHVQDGGPHDAALNLKQPVEVLQPLHFVVKFPCNARNNCQ